MTRQHGNEAAVRVYVWQRATSSTAAQRRWTAEALVLVLCRQYSCSGGLLLMCALLSPPAAPQTRSSPSAPRSLQPPRPPPRPGRGTARHRCRHRQPAARYGMADRLHKAKANKDVGHAQGNAEVYLLAWTSDAARRPAVCGRPTDYVNRTSVRPTRKRGVGHTAGDVHRWPHADAHPIKKTLPHVGTSTAPAPTTSRRRTRRDARSATSSQLRQGHVQQGSTFAASRSAAVELKDTAGTARNVAGTSGSTAGRQLQMALSSGQDVGMVAHAHEWVLKDPVIGPQPPPTR